MDSQAGIDLKTYIRSIPDFPKPGILFRDITTLIAAPEAFRECIVRLADRFRDETPDAVVAPEARGFIFGAPLALELKVPLVPVRKPGKLPGETQKIDYELEYGTDSLEIHVDGVKPGQNVLVIDDLLATGGTVRACCELLGQCGAKVIACAFVIHLLDLGGESLLAPHRVFSLVEY